MRFVQHVGDQLGGLACLGFEEAAGGHRRRTQTDAAGHHGFLRIVGDRVLVAGHVSEPQHALGLFAGDALGAQVNQHHMALGAARDDAQAAPHQGLGHGGGVLDHLLLVDLELGRQGLFECHRLGADHVHQRAALDAGEDGAVDLLGDRVLHQDQAATRTAQGLVRGRCDDVGIRHWVGVDARGDQAGIVRHVDHEIRPDGLGHLGETLEIDLQRVGRSAGDDQFRLVLMGQPFHRVVVDGLVGVQPVAHHLEPLARHVEWHAVGQVAAFGQAHAHDGVAGLQQREEHRLVGLRARIGLYVGILGAEQGLEPVDRQLLDDINVLAATVIAFAGIALGVLVGQLRALGLHHRWRGVVLAGDQLDVLFLAGVLKRDRGPEFGVDVGEGGLGTVKHCGQSCRGGGWPADACFPLQHSIHHRAAQAHGWFGGGMLSHPWQGRLALHGGGPPRAGRPYRQSRKSGKCSGARSAQQRDTGICVGRACARCR